MQQNVLKLADFGSCRSVYSKPPHTEYISTRWYRAPECLLTDGYYSLKMDIWSAGCVFFEIMRCFPRSFTCLTFTSVKSQHTVEFKPWVYLYSICIQLCIIWLFICIHIHKQMYGNTYVNSFVVAVILLYSCTFQLESSFPWSQWVRPGCQDPQCVGDTRSKHTAETETVRTFLQTFHFASQAAFINCSVLISDRSRAMHFNFPPKKGTGISRLLPNCPAPALSLLYQMLAYDSDERITAETALRHTYFREIRLGA